VFRTPRSLLTALVATTVLVSATLAWFGWRLLDQQQAVDEQRARQQLEATADALAAGIRGRLAEAGDRLSEWLSATAVPPAIDEAVALRIDSISNDVVLNPPHALPFVPHQALLEPPPGVFAAIEALEFNGSDMNVVAARYRALAAHSDAHVRAGALLRLGRVLRKVNDYRGALAAYRQLARLGPVRTDNLPAELAGLGGQRAALMAMNDREAEGDVTAKLLEGLNSGRWLITRGTAQFYREGLTSAPASDAWRLADALTEVWQEAGGRLSTRGQRVVTDGAVRVLVMWRSAGSVTALAAAMPERFFRAPGSAGVNWQLSDSEGRAVAGDAAPPSHVVTRVLGYAEFPWTLRAWEGAAAGARSPEKRTFLLGALMTMLGFLWITTYCIARAIRREAAVARLQSEFVAAVSHEFRSPLTTVRQMAEMLDIGDLPEPRRRAYYRVLVGEATRLQRLVETLLNFGRMEAGAAQYRFAEIDAAELVRAVVRDIEPQARESGKTIELSGDGDVRVDADESALSLAIRNLIENAIKYSPDEPTIWVECKKERDCAAISVIDRGLGIPSAEQDAVFQKFVRGRAAIDRNLKGTGVGLSMVRQIIDAHGGDIRVQSEAGRGSTFTLVLPVTDGA
jgi:two-component system phosphate regulon sensor histidine kinase PhoR